MDVDGGLMKLPLRSNTHLGWFSLLMMRLQLGRRYAFLSVLPRASTNVGCVLCLNQRVLSTSTSSEADKGSSSIGLPHASIGAVGEAGASIWG